MKKGLSDMLKKVFRQLKYQNSKQILNIAMVLVSME
jgi:hypothetical protein